MNYSNFAYVELKYTKAFNLIGMVVEDNGYSDVWEYFEMGNET